MNLPNQPLAGSETTSLSDETLRNGDLQVVHANGAIKQDATAYVRGTLMEHDGAKWGRADGDLDGKTIGVLAHDHDATAGDVNGQVYTSGAFNTGVMTIEGTVTAAHLAAANLERPFLQLTRSDAA